ncbi:Threonine aldolase [Bacillus pseudomycoides]|uniref:low-specificity L-threonine aldolase n=1 Tax=Bacillus pseudomycoides TaxID=64104 RepID=UPI0001A14DA0|nr:low-specificity L-threonine aldolase [Bacillus pseudomycoides]EEM07741.1 Threonine aldolase [Bacillus pseudomycoides]PDY45532.1 low-specificity L-threonine aldolase [Bacillus pseudomycoides]PGC26736.1 low-specificity L-threonine aldolase [Bacillus pseudomycoides]PHB44767.1 low-specificity L-threonine aldolase [Bacillus pseudomycoides]
MIELRSDTFTLPTEKMLKTMSSAALGDDIYGEDPTVHELEKLAARILDKEAGCFMPSGTMANLATLMAHCPRGTKAIVGNESDIYIYEAGGATICGGIVYEPIQTQRDGRLLINDIEKAFPDDPEDPQFALPSLVCIETPQNRCGGAVLPLEYLEELYAYTQHKGVPLHMDGARIFNAAVALNISPSEIAKFSDSVQFCLSKGLSAPIGSIVVGSSIFVKKVRRIRKMLGGSMRQAGIIASAGIVALNEMVDRLAEDHTNAQYFAEGLEKIPGISIDLNSIHTNIIIFELKVNELTLNDFIQKAHQQGVNISEFGHGRIRAVTHAGITKKDLDQALQVISDILKD